MKLRYSALYVAMSLVLAPGAVLAADQDAAEAARRRLHELYTIDDIEPVKRSPILAKIT